MTSRTLENIPITKCPTAYLVKSQQTERIVNKQEQLLLRKHQQQQNLMRSFRALQLRISLGGKIKVYF